MDSVAKLSDTERLEVFSNTSIKIKIPVAMVEKDFWVSWVLWKLFGNEELSKALRFKGGTSLSKGYNLIERFSEDLDIILAKELIIGEEPLFQGSYTKTEKFIESVNEQSAVYISTKLKYKIEILLDDIVKTYTDTEYVKNNNIYEQKEIDNNYLHIVYPKVASDIYLRPDILLELGIVSAWTPNEPKEISPYIAQVYPQLGIKPAIVYTIKAQRTFWDKATILHREYHRNNPTPARYSRHYYDLYQIGHSPIKDLALKDRNLLADVVDYKDKFYHSGGAKYDEVLTGGLHLLPNKNNHNVVAQDYKAMQSMIFGNTPEWDAILEYLGRLEAEINELARE